MYCPKCAAQNSDNARFCRECGFQMADSQTLKPPPPTPEKPKEDGTTTFFKWVGYIVVGIIVLSMLSTCFYF